LDIELFNSISIIKFKKTDDTNDTFGVVDFFNDFKVIGGSVSETHRIGFLRNVRKQEVEVLNYLKSRNDFFAKGFEVFGTEKKMCLVCTGSITNNMKELIVSKSMKASLISLNRFFDIDISSLKSELVGITNFLIVHDSFKDDNFFVNFSKRVLNFADNISVCNIRELEKLEVFMK